MVHAVRLAPRVHPDASRIAGYAVAIALNAALLLLLLVPIGAPPPAVVEEVPYRWYLPDPPRPPTPPPPQRVDVRPPSPTAPIAHATTTPQPTPPADAVVVDQGTQAAVPAADTAVPGPVSIAPSLPVQGVHLEYGDAPAPRYPPQALRAGIEGTVLLQVLVDVDGRPLDVQVYRSSGNRQLDAAAREQVLRRWVFRPAMQDGHAVQAIGLVPIAFSLD